MVGYAGFAHEQVAVLVNQRENFRNIGGVIFVDNNAGRVRAFVQAEAAAILDGELLLKDEEARLF